MKLTFLIKTKKLKNYYFQILVCVMLGLGPERSEKRAKRA